MLSSNPVKLLQALAYVDFGGVDVAFRICGDAMRAKELAWVASTVAEAVQVL